MTGASDEQPNVTQLVRNHGWRQGSILTQEHAAQVIPYAPDMIRIIPTEDLLIVVSHDCDVANPTLAIEPYIELIVAHRIPTPDGNMQHARNSRTLHVSISSGETEVEEHLELRSFERFFAPRELMASSAPTGELSPEAKRALGRWLANRYQRPAFPDAFNERLFARSNRRHARKAQDAFKNPDIGWLTTGVYLQLEPEGELPEEESYIVRVVATMRSSDYVNPSSKEAVERQLLKFAAALDETPGISVEDSVVVSDAEFSIEDVATSLRFDFDFVSLRSGEDTALPPG